MIVTIVIVYLQLCNSFNYNINEELETDNAKLRFLHYNEEQKNLADELFFIT